jgi:putative MATE family efflux protein
MGGAPIAVLLFRYSAPAMLAMFVNSLYNLVDSIFVGRGAGTLALAGLAVSFPIQMIVLAAAQTVGIGAASLISRSLGAGNARRAERAAGTSFAAIIVLSLGLTAGGLLALRPLLILFGATDDVLPYATDYLSRVLLGSVFFGFAVSSNNVVRAEGNARVAMITMLIGAAVNVVLDPILIFGLGMGIRGAAWATVAAHAAAFFFLCFYFLSGRSMLHIRRGDLWPDFLLLAEIFIIGGSSFVRMVAGSMVAIVFNNSIRWYGEDLHLAILGVINRIMLFVAMPVFGLAQGFQPIVGFNYGARDAARVRAVTRAAALAATVICTAGFIGIMIFAKQMVAVFNPDPRMVREGAFILRIVVVSLPFVGFQVIGATFFQAAGRAVPALFLSMSRQILFLIPLLLGLPLLFGLNGLWFAPPIADSTSVVVTALWLVHAFRHIEKTGIPEQKKNS